MSSAVVEFEARSVAVRRAGESDVAGRSVVGTRATRPVRPPARLTRRGRLTVFLGSTALALGAFAWVGGPAASTGEEHHVTTRTVVVAPGQTLWDIAADEAPDEDPRAVIAEIVELNDLGDAGAVRAGQPLYLPAE